MTKDKTIEEIKCEDYIKWVEDKLLLKTDGIEITTVRPVLYQVWSNVKALVANDLHKRHADERWYHEYKEDIYRFIGDTVSDAMYMLDKVGALKAQNETLTPKDQVQAECECAEDRPISFYDFEFWVNNFADFDFDYGEVKRVMEKFKETFKEQREHE